MSTTEHSGLGPAAPAAFAPHRPRGSRPRWALAALLALGLASSGANDRPAAVGPRPEKAGPVAVGPAASAPLARLTWDALSKSRSAKPGETEVEYEFVATNGSSEAIAIVGIHTTCGCTVAQLPPLPERALVLAPGARTTLRVKLDLQGKVGAIAKTVRVETSLGSVQLTVHADVAVDPGSAGPAGGMGAARARNIEIAARSRQAVFQGDCVKCHGTPAAGKMGEDLYLAVCTLCHDAHPRAPMIPDLNVPRGPRDLAFWTRWIADGAPGTMMPAFAAAHGGPLTPDQVTSLARYLYDAFPRAPLAAPAETSAGEPPAPSPR
jgi:cytochrome c5